MSFLYCVASIASPLTIFTQKSVKFESSEAWEKSFLILKESFTSAPVLTLLERTNFVVYCDAYNVSLGRVLMQHEKVIAYDSR